MVVQAVSGGGKATTVLGRLWKFVHPLVRTVLPAGGLTPAGRLRHSAASVWAIPWLHTAPWHGLVFVAGMVAVAYIVVGLMGRLMTSVLRLGILAAAAVAAYLLYVR